ncbi:MliC family protein [Shewanella pealeana]|uniref:C-type lysozyme inhibitor domain-containing protein n=1 Tax=Shewanella pealeana (strain ATCC 700345 / ANG-SQ1) TaxID=398579 RepID=A8H9K0_SHEPA|nr:MliC family protein [Shewanella pealeana]ABV89237.1 conserved hypothetical protein [Shewanella pealeana ATCC 700345]
MHKYIFTSWLILLTACSTVADQKTEATKDQPVKDETHATITPSFDCAKAQGKVETLICDDAELAKLDREMAQVYQQAMVNIPPSAQPKATQRGWIKGRNDCWKAQDVRQCTLDNYQIRLIELQIQGRLIEPSSTAVFDCGNRPQISAVFYTQVDPVTAVFTFSSEKMGDQQLLATNVRSGSGAKYLGRNFEFWEHQGEASVQFFDHSYKCKLLK